MQLEARGSGRNLYLYRSERRGDTVRKVYVGGGALARAIYERERRSKVRKRSVAMEQRLILQEYKDIDTRLDDYLSRSYVLAGIYLAAAGCHRPNRGTWRKKRDKTMATAKSNVPTDIPTEYKEQARIIGLAMDQKRPADIARAIQIIESGKCQVHGMMLAEVDALISEYAMDDPLQVALQKSDFKSNFQALTGAKWDGLENTTLPPMEYILAERVLLCRMHLIRSEARLARATTVKMVEFHEKRVDMAQRRYLAAIKTLAEVKRLRLPVVNVAMPGSMQVNVAEKQINLSATMSSDSQSSPVMPQLIGDPT